MQGCPLLLVCVCLVASSSVWVADCVAVLRGTHYSHGTPGTDGVAGRSGRPRPAAAPGPAADARHHRISGRPATPPVVE